MNRTLAAIGLSVLAAVMALPAGAQTYPNKPVRLIVPYPPGGGTDISGRIVADALSQRLGQQVVVENRPGATGMIGSDYVMKSAPDGYTLLWNSTDSITIVPALKPDMAYKVPEDVTFIAKVAETGNSFAVSANLPVKTLAEFIAYAKANPGKVRFGSTGVGGSPHMTALLFEKETGIKLVHVPYKGIAPALTDLLGGHIDMALVTPISLAPYVTSDKIRILGISAGNRHPMLPDAKTMAELGLPKATVTLWYGLMGPAKLPAPVLEKLQTEIKAVFTDAGVKASLQKAGLAIAPLYGADFRKAAVDELEQWKALGKSENIKLE